MLVVDNAVLRLLFGSLESLEVWKFGNGRKLRHTFTWNYMEKYFSENTRLTLLRHTTDVHVLVSATFTAHLITSHVLKLPMMNIPGIRVQ